MTRPTDARQAEQHRVAGFSVNEQFAYARGYEASERNQDTTISEQAAEIARLRQDNATLVRINHAQHLEVERLRALIGARS